MYWDFCRKQAVPLKLNGTLVLKNPGPKKKKKIQGQLTHMCGSSKQEKILLRN